MLVAGEDWKLLICVRHDLNMSVGKVAAQVGHAVHHAVTNSRPAAPGAQSLCEVA